MADGRTALWTGSVSFGLVNVPVAMLTAVRSRRGTFHLLHEKDGARLKRRMYCPAEKEFVEPDRMVRGYEIEEGGYVVVSDDEIRSIAPRRGNTIEIQEFVDLGEIAPALYERPYYLVPAGPEKPYRLLAEVLGDLNKAGIAEFVMNARQKFCSVQNIGGALCLMVMRYPEELRAADELAPDAEARPKDVKAMLEAIGGMDYEFDPAKLTDEYEERVARLIERKKKRKEIIRSPEIEEEEPEREAEEAEEVDLITALEQSLARERERGEAGS